MRVRAQGGRAHQSRLAWVLVGAVLVAVGVVAGLVWSAARTPEVLQPAVGASSFPVEVMEFVDAQPVSLSLVQEPGAELISRAPGVVTASVCPGAAELTSGASPWSIDGVPVLALATGSPLYRDLKMDDTGPDVDALQLELARLGEEVSETGVVDAATVAAWRAVQQQVGAPATDVLPATEVVWLPAPSTTVATCSARLGGVATEGAVLATSAATTTGVAIETMPSVQVEGPRQVVVGEVVLSVSPGGAVGTPGQVKELLQTPIGMAAAATVDTEVPVPLSGDLVLVEPVRAATVPASAVVSRVGTCVEAIDGAAVPVSIVGSGLARSTVTFAGPAPEEVQVDPADDVSCG